MRRAIPAAGGGAGAAIGLWLVDLLSLSQLRFAGVSDAAAQAGVVAAARSSLVGFELRLFLLHGVIGALLGLLAIGWTPAHVHALSRTRTALRAAALVLVLHAIAAAGTMAHYPQLYSDRWWRAGGWRALVQRTITHSIGPAVFDWALGVCALLLVGCALRRVPRRTRWLLCGAALGVAAAAVALPVSGRARHSAEQASRSRTDVLVLTVDSLRSDRITSAEVMPFVSSLVRSGTLFRSAFTPVAHTFPSWVSTLTGAEPRHHGVRSMFPARENLANVGPTLFTELRDQGFRTFVVSHFAGDVFTRFDGGFETIDAPELTADTLATSTALAAHTATLPLLRARLGRRLLPEWRNMPNLDDPEWLVDAALGRLRRSAQGPAAGLVFFGTSHFPYVAPYPYYLRGSDGYRGGFLYDVPPSRGEPVTPADVEQARARYDAALTAVDHAIARLCRELAAEGRLSSTLIIVTGDHGEELYEQQDLAGHGDALTAHAQQVPLLIVGPGVPPGRESRSQVRLYDLPATVLSLLDPRREPTFGDGVSVLGDFGARPICVETALWFWPDLPQALRGERLVYDPVSKLLEVEAGSRALVLRSDRVTAVEDAKDRGIVLGNRLYHQRTGPRGIRSELLELAGVAPEWRDVDLRALFRDRCVRGDPELAFVLGAVVHVSRGDLGSNRSQQECSTCGVGR